MKSTTTLITLCCIASGLFVGANAQESSRSAPTVGREWPAPGKLQLRVQDLQQDREQIQDVLTDDFRRTQSYKTRPVMLDALRKRIKESFRQRESQYDGIRLRLDRLENALTSERKSKSAAPEPLIPQSPTATSESVPAETGNPPPAPAEDASPPATIAPPTLTKPPVPAPVKPAPTIVTESAVDRIALADSLFASHQVEIALKLYLELSREKQTKDDLVWIHYQIGSSSRRIKNYDQARKYYRIVAGKPEAGLYQKLSKWWLDTLQRKLAYVKEQNGLQAFIDQVGGSDVAATK